MNTNLIHNVINVIIAVIAALSVPEVQQLIPPEYSVMIIGVLSTAKLVINVIRDGLAGLVKKQPPVV